MRLHSFEHVPFEDLTNIGVWARNRGYVVSHTRWYENDSPPPLSSVDWLVVMGGPMNIYEEDRYPWLAREKTFIADAIAGGKLVLGVCLGAQLIADVLGGPVSRNQFKEIGWFPVSLTASATDSPLLVGLPQEFIAFHWHGDTFQMPPGAVPIASSRGCANQAFIYRNRVAGLQFHLESTPDSVSRLIRHCGGELVEAPFIQSPAEMLAPVDFFLEIEKIMTRLLDNMAQEAQQ
ncbi:MAG TPA: amidotransferase [Desulfobacterales bacterium]|nr:amidotransferase [Desulfobacterales bacterium]